MKLLSKDKYLFESRVITHVLFWVLYYTFFSLIWAKEGAFFQSFQLEFLLMPIRIGASYVSLYYLIPAFLAKGKEAQFLIRYLLLVALAGILQRFLNYFFHEFFFANKIALWEVVSFIKSIVLINTTVMLLSALKVYKEWMNLQKVVNNSAQEELLEIKSDKRFYRIAPSSIQYIEGLGNYVTIYLKEGKNLIAYMTLKEAESILPAYFQRIHKSFIVNSQEVSSYNNENVEVTGRIIPIGKSYTFI